MIQETDQQYICTYAPALAAALPAAAALELLKINGKKQNREHK